MSNVATPLPFEKDLHFVVRHEGKIHVTMGAYVYDPDLPDATAEEKAAVEKLEGMLGAGDVAVLEPGGAEAGLSIWFVEG